MSFLPRQVGMKFLQSLQSTYNNALTVFFVTACHRRHNNLLLLCTRWSAPAMDFQCEDCDDQEYKGYACDPVINGRATLLLIITAQEYESLYSECSV